MSYRRFGFAAVLAIALAAAPVSSLRPSSLTETSLARLDRLERLFREDRYFELSRALARAESEPSPELDFFRGAVDQAFNRLDSAVFRLDRYLEYAAAHPKPRFLREALTLLADACFRSGRYAKSAAAQLRIFDAFGAVLTEEEKAICRNEAALWSSFTDVPPPTAEIGGDSTIRTQDRHLPVRVNGREVFMAFDSGANLSVLCEGEAVRLGIVKRGVGVAIQSSTGNWVTGRAAVVPEIRLGEVVIRDAIFLIMPDEALALRRLPSGARSSGLLGAPILCALKEITETADGFVLIPASPSTGRARNMFFYGFMPIVEVVHRNRPLLMCLDTGAEATILHPTFLRLYRGEIESRSLPRKSLFRGIGGTRAVGTRFLDWFAFKTGGRDIALRRVVVQTQATNSYSLRFAGTLGLDVLTQCSQITLNFESMSFVIE